MVFAQKHTASLLQEKRSHFMHVPEDKLVRSTCALEAQKGHFFPLGSGPFSRLFPPEKQYFFDTKKMFQSCSVCDAAPTRVQLLPDRIESDPPYVYQILCPLCLDDFLDVFPSLHRALVRREVTGKLGRLGRLDRLTRPRRRRCTFG